MLDARRPVIVRSRMWFGVPIGLLAGVGGWMLFGPSLGQASALPDLETRLTAADRPGPRASAPVEDFVGQALASPMFPMVTGPKAVKEPSLLLQGVARTPRRTAALLSINGAAADWLERGSSRDGVTLVEVRGSVAVVETVLGRKELMLGQLSGPAPGTADTAASPERGGP